MSLRAYAPQGGQSPQQRGPRYLQVLLCMGKMPSGCDEWGGTRGMQRPEVKLNPRSSQGSLRAQLLIKTYQDKN